MFIREWQALRGIAGQRVHAFPSASPSGAALSSAMRRRRFRLCALR